MEAVVWTDCGGWQPLEVDEKEKGRNLSATRLCEANQRDFQMKAAKMLHIQM